jgi:hypothetical protein
VSDKNKLNVLGKNGTGGRSCNDRAYRKVGGDTDENRRLMNYFADGTIGFGLVCAVVVERFNGGKP